MALHSSLDAGGWSSLAQAALTAWLTYALHAAAWALAAAALTRRTSWSMRGQSHAWRVAVLAPLATASLALLLPFGLEPALVTPPGPAIQVAWVGGAPLVPGISPAHAAWAALGVGVVTCALGGLLRWWVGAALLARRLRDRSAVSDARWLERLERLRLRTQLAHVRLTESRKVESPLVLGLSEICVPTGLLPLGDGELDNVLAHELSHLERRDGLWFPLLGAVASALWLPPLAAWAAARFRASAEQACDDRAVELTRDALGLARVLLQLASSPAARVATLAPTMAGAKGALLQRIRRLTSDRPSGPQYARSRATLLVGLALTTLGLGSVGVSVRVALASATPPVSAARRSSARPASAAPTLAPDAVASGAQLAELARRARAVEARLNEIANLPDAQRAGSPAAVRLLELQQELGHLRQTQAWLEERFVEAERAWQAQASGARP